MREYETTIIVQPEISSEGTETILQKMDSVLDREGAARLMCADLGKRRLAYEIRKFHKGHYYTLSFCDGGKVVPELERALRMEESVLRFMTVQVDDDVTDLEARQVRARELEIEQRKRAAEKAEREAEEARARAEVERLAAEEAQGASELPEGDEDARTTADDAASDDGDSDDDSEPEAEEADDEDGDRS